MAKKTLCLIGAILFGAFVFMACDAFYSTSWGTQREYDAANIKLSTSNLDDWVTRAVGNRDLAKTLAQKIESMVGDMGETPERAKFQSAGVQLAFEASGLGANVLNEIAGLANLIDAEINDSDQELINFLNAVRAAGWDPSVADIVAAIVRPSIKQTPPPPEFYDTYKSATSASDVAEAAILLILATIGDTSDLKGEFAKKFSVAKPGEVKIFSVKTGDTDPKSLALAAYLNFISTEPTDKFKDHKITLSLKNIIDKVEVTP